MPTPRFEITDRVQLFSGETGQVVDILEFDDRRNGYKYLVARGPSDRGQVWHEVLMEEAGGHTPNRALNRAQLETIAWQVTPSDYRGGSGSRRTVLWNTSEGTTLMPLSDLTDNQIRKYIGPDALERGGDMKKNGSPETAPKFRPGDQVTDLEGSMEGTVMYVTTSGPFDKVPYRCLVQETSGGRYRERPWGENQLRLLRSGPGSFDMRPNAARRSEADETAARELSLYIENDYALVGAPNSQGKSIEKNLLQKIRKGSFDLARSEDAWMYLMEAGAKKYAKEYASPKDWSVMFNKATRELVAHEFATTFYEENKGSR